MIAPAKNFVGVISDREIDEAAELYGYEDYIPYEFVKDLLHCWTNLVINDDFSVGILVETPYEREFLKFVQMLPDDASFYTDGKKFVFEILKKYSSQLNFRAIEKSKKNGIAFEMEMEEQFNYDIDLTEIGPKTLDLLGADIKSPSNEMKLSKETLIILRFLNGFHYLPGLTEEISKIVRTRMKNYSQIVKVSKHRLVYPTFKYNYIMKNLRTKIPIVEKKDKTKIVLVVDISSSIEKEDSYILLYKAVLLNYYRQFKDGITEIDIHFITDKPKYYRKILHKQELIELIDASLTPHISLRSWQQAYNYLETRYKQENIVFLTDGTSGYLSFHKSPPNVWTVLSFENDKYLEALCNRTNGKFIKI